MPWLSRIEIAQKIKSGPKAVLLLMMNGQFRDLNIGALKYFDDGLYEVKEDKFELVVKERQRKR